MQLIYNISMITCIGEILVDVFIDEGNRSVHPGGAPFNVACNLASFGTEVNFCGSVGNDDCGRFLKDFAVRKPLKSLIETLNGCHTTEAVVTLTGGERSFKFNRVNGADYHHSMDIFNNPEILNSKIIHMGSLMLSEECGRKFFDEACDYIHEHSEALISFDVNYREDIYKSREDAKKASLATIRKSDIVKFTGEELELLTGKKNVAEALPMLLNDRQIAVVTFGKDGSMYYSAGRTVTAPAYYMEPIDTTGAGDAFYSYFLYELDGDIDLNNDEEIAEVLKKANLCGGFATQKQGAIDVVPSLNALNEFLQRHQ